MLVTLDSIPRSSLYVAAVYVTGFVSWSADDGRTGTDPAVSEAHARVLLRERWPHAEIEWLAACDRDRPPLFDVTEEC